MDSLSPRQRAAIIPVTMASMIVGGAVCGGIFAAVAAAAELLPRHAWVWFCGLVGVWAGVTDILLAKVPTGHWLVPRRWAYWPWPAYHVVFGVILGMGWLTVIPFATYYLLIALLLMLDQPWLSVMVMTVFGAGRAIPLLLMSSGILRDACEVGGSKRAWERRCKLHAWADSLPMRLMRVAGAAAAMPIIWRML